MALPRDQAAAHVASAVGVEGAGCWRRRKGEEVESHHWMDLELAVHLDGPLRQHEFVSTVSFVARLALLWEWVGVHCELLAQGREREGPEPRDLRLRRGRRLPGLVGRVG